MKTLQKEVELPEYAQKRIYWNKEGSGTGVVLVGYCPDTLAYFLAMYEEAKKTFPQLKMNDCTCSKVHTSNCIKGFTVLLFNVSGEKREYAGWDSWNMSIDFLF